MSHSPAPQQYAAMQRRIFALEEENTRLINKMVKRPVKSYVREGRAIRRLVCLMDPAIDLIHEYDRRTLLAVGPDDIDDVASTAKQERLYRSYKKLLQWCPSIVDLVQGDTDVVGHACAELRRGGDCARGDDANNLKRSTALWLNSQIPHPEPLISSLKENRGFSHDVTGGLICPIDYDWTDSTIRNAIRNYDQRYPVTASMWSSFLYAAGQYQRNRPSLGLFKGAMLLRAFRSIFTSPSSAAHEDPENEANEELRNRRSLRRVRTRNNVATLLKMRKVEPRAIAYVAVQLRFALSSRTSWDFADDNFDYEVFYNNMLDWFERPRTEAKAQMIQDLLLWWNEKIFGGLRASAMAVDEQDIASMSVAASMG